MAEVLKAVFANKKAKDQAAFVTFLTAGFPTRDATVPLMLAMEAGGADIIELGIPFSDPIADGPTIQDANNVALANGINYTDCLEYVREARKQGLKAPVIFMGYYNPILSYTEERAVADAKEAGANGFIVVDLPPEEAVAFRKICTGAGISYVPLVAPSTTIARVKFLASIADSFIYVVSKMGTTGSSANTNMSAGLPELIARIRSFTPVPLAVGFGVANRTHFEAVVASGADGVVIGSKIITVVKAAPQGQAPSAIQAYCHEISHIDPNAPKAERQTFSLPDATSQAAPELAEQLDTSLPSRFGSFGGAYVAESLYECLTELEAAHKKAMSDPEFWKELESYYPYMNRPSGLYFAENLTEYAGGAKIWLKREDMNFTGSHKINNAMAQCLLAKRMGKKRVIAETGAGQHGIATATACAKFGLECVVFMGASDVEKQALNVFKIKLHGASVVAVEEGSRSLKDAVNAAMRHWVERIDDTAFVIGSAIGPHPFPTIVRDFQAVIGREIKAQCKDAFGGLPDALVACCGGGSNAIGTFYDFIKDEGVALYGVEAGGDGINTARHSATLAMGRPGVLHGTSTYILQTKEGQITPTGSISSGLDYPGVGPEHAMLHASGRGKYIVATDEDCLRAFVLITQKEGILPALESAHAVWGGIQLAKTLPKDKNIVITVSGRGDKDAQSMQKLLGEGGPWADRIGFKLPN